MKHIARFAGARVLAALGVAVVLLAGAFALRRLDAPATSSAVATDKPTTANTPLALADSDGDGLADWEETLRGTNPTNPDSDGDGTKDGEEVALGRNPLVAGPDDEYAGQASPTKTKENLTAKERFAKDLFDGYLSVAKGDGTLSSREVDTIAKQVVDDITASPIEVKTTYSFDSVIQVPTNAESLRRYGNTLGEWFAQTLTPQTSEVLALRTFTQSGNPEDIKNLDAIVAWYGNAIQHMLATPAPESLAGVHLVIVQSLENIREWVAALQYINDDPFRPLTLLNQYGTALERLRVAFRTVATTIRTAKVEFADDEPGIDFLNAIEQ